MARPTAPPQAGGELSAIAAEIALLRAAAYGDGRPLLLTLDPWPHALDTRSSTSLAALLDAVLRLARLPGRPVVQVFATALRPPTGVDVSGWRVLDLTEKG